MTSTPEQKRDAWLALVSQVETILVKTRVNAKASASMATAVLEDTGWKSDRSTEDWDATAWAAQRLLSDLQALKVPAVPRDDARGQASIYDMPGIAPTLRVTNAMTEAPSTSGENPGDEPQPGTLAYAQMVAEQNGDLDDAATEDGMDP